MEAIELRIMSSRDRENTDQMTSVHVRVRVLGEMMIREGRSVLLDATATYLHLRVAIPIEVQVARARLQCVRDPTHL